MSCFLSSLEGVLGDDDWMSEIIKCYTNPVPCGVELCICKETCNVIGNRYRCMRKDGGAVFSKDSAPMCASDVPRVIYMSCLLMAMGLL